MDRAHEPCAWIVRMSHAHRLGRTSHTRPRESRDLEFRPTVAAKRATNLSVRGDLVDAARAERLNLSALFEWALEQELLRMKSRRWRKENAAAIAAYNRHLQGHGAFAQRRRW